MEGSNYRNIKEDYKIEGTIGRGSFATVKRAKNRATGDRVAVKVLSKRKMSDEEKEAMQTEIEILKQLDHPNIVKLLDVYEDERHWCLVMELMTGGELFDMILEKEQFDENEAREAIKIMIDALSYCHQNGILHRDIKPENLLIGSKKQGIVSLKIADFGLARLLEEDQLASTTCGTPGYVAPEVLKLISYGKECDYWSVGVVAFILLSGSPPFYEEDNFELFEKIKNCDYEFDEDTWKNISSEAKDFVQKILVGDPKIRLNFDQMTDHSWMKKVFNSDDKKQIDNKKLKKYLGLRKDKSSRKNVQKEDDDNDD